MATGRAVENHLDDSRRDGLKESATATERKMLTRTVELLYIFSEESEKTLVRPYLLLVDLSLLRRPARWGPPDGWEPPGARSRKVDSLKKERMETLKLKTFYGV